MKYDVTYGPDNASSPLALADRTAKGYLSQGRNAPFMPRAIGEGSGSYAGAQNNSRAGDSVFRKGLEYFASLGVSVKQYFADGARELVRYANLRGGASLPYDPRSAEEREGGHTGFGPAVSSMDLGSAIGVI